MRAKELVIRLSHSNTNIVVLALLTIIGIVAAVPFLRHRVKKIYTRKVLGSFAWMLVRLAIAIPATILFEVLTTTWSDTLSGTSSRSSHTPVLSRNLKHLAECDRSAGRRWSCAADW